MSDDELTAAFAELRTLCTSIMGFHDLAEGEAPAISEVRRVMYGAQVYANGVALAHRVLQLADELQQRGEP